MEVDKTRHKITQVEPVKRPRGYCAVYVDGSLALTAHQQVVASLGLRAGETFGSEQLAAAIVAAQEQEALRWALRRLSPRDRTEQELRRGLTRQGFPQPVIATVLDRLRDKGLIDDRRYAREYMRIQSARRRFGTAAQRAKNLQLGFDSKVIDKEIELDMP